MADFQKALPYILKNEGGYVNNPNDHGGATNLGITQRTLNQFRGRRPDYPADVKDLTEDQAGAIYRELYWNPIKGDQIDDQLVATKVFDMAVNFGPIKASKMLQSSVNAMADGVIGPKTLGLVNINAPQDVLNKLVDQCVSRYTYLASHDQSQVVFLNGWLKRARRLPE